MAGGTQAPRRRCRRPGGDGFDWRRGRWRLPVRSRLEREDALRRRGRARCRPTRERGKVPRRRPGYAKYRMYVRVMQVCDGASGEGVGGGEEGAEAVVRDGVEDA